MDQNLNRFAPPEAERFYDGPIYRFFIEPLLWRLRRAVRRAVGRAHSVLDIGCGTGALALEFAGHYPTVTGIDRSPAMIRVARKRARRKRRNNVFFYVLDAAALESAELPKGIYDVSIFSMVLHEMPEETRKAALRGAAARSRKIIAADYAVPLPVNAGGIGARFAEFFAGGDHFANYRVFRKQGGLDPLFADFGKRDISETRIHGGVVRILTLRSQATAGDGGLYGPTFR